MPKRVNELPYSVIFNNILDGFSQVLTSFFGNTYNHKLKAVEVENDDALAKIASKTNQDKIGFPFFGYKWNSTDERPGEFNDWLFRQQGTTMKNEAGEFYQVQLLPVNILGSIYFLCNDRKDVRLYAQRWRDCAKMHYLDFDIDINGLSFRIRVECDTSYPFPDFQTGNQDVVDMYNVETSITIHGYSGSITPMKPVTRFNVNVYDINSFAPKESQRILLWNETIDSKPDGLYHDDKLLIAKGSKWGY